MSNLGWYQRIVEWSKRVGGPQYLLLIAMGTGAVVEKTTSMVINAICKKVKNSKNEHVKDEYILEEDIVVNDRLKLQKGDKIRIINKDKDVVLIEKVGDNNNPYCISNNVFASECCNKDCVE